ncbi:MAG: tRNA (adenine(22)-N(1))-methyltransferase [Roseburia sp.]
MAQRLSKRMQAVADMVSPCAAMADIGTDHGYVPIYLLEQGRVERAIAMDINRGPLMRAEKHIQDAGLCGYIETRQSDGLERLMPGEVSCVTIAGMGGGLMIRILSSGQAVTEQLSQLILQPQSEIPAVRNFVQQAGWKIVEEEMLSEEGKYYMMMKCVPGQMEPLTAVQCAYGPLLTERKHPVLKRYLEERILQLRNLLEGLSVRAETEGIRIRSRELAAELAVAEDAYKEICL